MEKVVSVYIAGLKMTNFTIWTTNVATDKCIFIDIYFYPIKELI